MILKACLFTNSPDRHFILDLHPDYPQVSFAAGFSGHGYKFASVIGEILADLAERQSSRHDISLFNIARFTGRVSSLHRERMEMLERGHWSEPGHSPQHPFYRGVQSREVPGGSLGRPIERSMPRLAGGRTSVVGRGSSSQYNRHADDSSDPRYWEAADVKPFW